VPLVNLKTADRLARSVGRQPVKLAWTTVGAIAIDELSTLDHPFCVDHG
jgi:hypothetical protein